MSMIKNLEKKEFECYSKKLYGFLVMKGFRYERSFKHSQTGRICWVYKMDDALSAALTEWKNSRPEKDVK